MARRSSSRTSRRRASKPRTKRAARSRRQSLRSLARALGVDEKAVRKGIASGRLQESVGRDGRGPFVRDVELARREWVAGAAQPPNGGGHDKPPAAAAPGGQLQLPEQQTLVSAQMRVASERATALELDNQRRRGQLLDAGTVKREQFEAARVVRDAILNIPDRIAASLASETDPRRVYELLRAELHRALTGLADELERG